MTDHVVPMLLVAACMVLEGLFSGGEIALVASDIHKIRRRAMNGSRSAMLAMKLLARPEWFLATTLTGTNLCVIISTSLVTAIFISRFGVETGGVLSTAVMIPLVLVVAEIVPKSIFQQHPESVALRIAGFVRAASWILYPLVFIVAWLARGGVYLITAGAVRGYSPYITKEGLKFLLRGQDEKGDLQPGEKEMIRRVFDFSETRVGQIMVPLSNVAALEQGATIDESIALIREKGFSRIPIYREHIFDITGILRSFDLLSVHAEELNGPITPHVRSGVYYVPETKLADELLLDLQRRREVMAVVVDEYGGAVGIVTVEDLLEEVVGEIEDEYDKGEKPYRKVAPGRYLFKARTSIDHVRELIHLEIPEGDYETLGGFILQRLGKIPRRGESVKEGEALFIVEDADARSVREVLIVFSEDRKDSSEFRV